MAKTIGNVGVTISANTLGFQHGLRTVSAGVKQFAATTRIAAGVAGTFDNSIVRLGADVSSFSNAVRNSVPGITATFAALGGIVLGLTTNFKELKAAAISSAEAVADFFTKNPHIGRDAMGGDPNRGPSMSGDTQREIQALRNQAAFDRGELTRTQFLRRKALIEGSGAFGAEQLTAAKLEAEAAARASKAKEVLSGRALQIIQEQRMNFRLDEEAAEQRLEIEREIVRVREDAIAAEHEAGMQRFRTERDAAEGALVMAGIAKPSRFESNPFIRTIMEFQEKMDDLQGGTTGANFGISSSSFRNAPLGQVIGEQREQEETNNHLEEIKDIQRELLQFVQSNGFGVTVR